VTRALILELAVFVGYLVAWELTVGERSAGLQLGMLMVSAVALGIQSSAVQRLGVSGLSSTYLTGTLTNLVGDLAARSPWPVLRPRLQILLALMTGAAVGAVLAVQLPWLAPVLLVVPLAGVIVLSRWPRTR
jgi:uncharacterized membrane protein YoaK (UPF0700 family)